MFGKNREYWRDREDCLPMRDNSETLENNSSNDNFVDFKGWRFRAPWRCMCCGMIISLQQFCFGRSCGGCDLGRCNHEKGSAYYSGPRELIDRNAEYFIPEEKWLPVDALPSLRYEKRPVYYKEPPRRIPHFKPRNRQGKPSPSFREPLAYYPVKIAHQ